MTGMSYDLCDILSVINSCLTVPEFESIASLCDRYPMFQLDAVNKQLFISVNHNYNMHFLV